MNRKQAGIMIGTCAAVLIAVAAGAAYLRQTGEQPDAIYTQADVNQDGKITPNEFRTSLSNMTEDHFRLLDMNGDGVFSPEDYHSGDKETNRLVQRAAKMIALFNRINTNGDQQLSFDEVKTALPYVSQATFNQFDRNGDGVINREDFQQAIAEKFKRGDRNHDGLLSPEEVQTAFPRLTPTMFKRLDRNGDGFLSPADRNL